MKFCKFRFDNPKRKSWVDPGPSISTAKPNIHAKKNFWCAKR